jgi:hypothetical protein
MPRYVRDEARVHIAREWRTWAIAAGLDPDRPTEAGFRTFYQHLNKVQRNWLACLASDQIMPEGEQSIMVPDDGADYWLEFLRQLALQGYVPTSRHNDT